MPFSSIWEKVWCVTLFSLLCILQAYVFHQDVHPEYPEFRQCVSLDAIQSKVLDSIYQISSVLLFYIIPLAVIMWCYTKIYRTVQSKSKEANEQEYSPTQGTVKNLSRMYPIAVL